MNRGDGSMTYREILNAATARRMEQEAKRKLYALRKIAREAMEDQGVGD